MILLELGTPASSILQDVPFDTYSSSGKINDNFLPILLAACKKFCASVFSTDEQFNDDSIIGDEILTVDVPTLLYQMGNLI